MHGDRYGSRIPVFKPKLPDPIRFQERFQSIHSSSIYSNGGPQVRELEGRLSAFLGAEANRVCVVSNATQGISLSVSALGGKKWLVPSWTFPGTVGAVAAAGAIPILGDVNQSSQYLRLPSGRDDLDGVIPVIPFGSSLQAIEWEAYRGLTRVVVDAAASLGNAGNLDQIIPRHAAVVFSLHATKVLGSGEGGVIVAGSAELATEIRARSNFGFTGTRDAMFPGVNAKMSEFQAAIANVVLDSAEEELREWQELREQVSDLSNNLGIRMFVPGGSNVSPYWNVFLPESETIERWQELLTQSGIESRRWWSNGIHTMPAYSSLELAEPMTNTDWLAGRLLGLPFHRFLDHRDLQRIGGVLNIALGR